MDNMGHPLAFGCDLVLSYFFLNAAINIADTSYFLKLTVQLPMS